MDKKINYKEIKELYKTIFIKKHTNNIEYTQKQLNDILNKDFIKKSK